ncbi:MAG: CTP-dependent riboflavin kinase [Thaumarchaeota archaeon]|nr:CTP-dependent riboflavin kinase [Nitrososphaerota archaeon]
MSAKTRPTAQQLSTLVKLMELGAGGSDARVSSSTLGEVLGLSQQAASKRLIELERAGLVRRTHSGRGLTVALTPPGRRAVLVHYGELKQIIEGRSRPMLFAGKVFTGLREGAYYVSLKGYAAHFRSSLGFVPFPGTLNLRLAAPSQVVQRAQLNLLRGIEVPGFEDGRRTYGPVKCFRAEVAGKLPGAILVIERTHYDDSVLEVIAPVNLREALGLKDGDGCQVSVLFD